MNITEGYKQCTKCGEIKPATIEFFYWVKCRGNWKSSCRQCQSESYKRYRQANPDKRRESVNRWRQANYRKYREGVNQWQQANTEKVRLRAKSYRQANANKVREYNKCYRQTNLVKVRESVRRWQQNNPDKVRIGQRRWAKANLDKYRKYNHQHRARKHSLPHTFTEQDWQRALEYFNGCCAYCGNPPSLFDAHSTLHQEHHAPEIKGGDYTPNNIIPACQSCNFSKHDHDAEQWIMKHFGKKKGKSILKKICTYFEWTKQYATP